MCTNNYFLRVYWDHADREELQTLKTAWLVDEFEQSLHSKREYKEALNHLLEVCPQISDYLAEFQLLLTGDFPTWKYNKKLIAEVQRNEVLTDFFFFQIKFTGLCKCSSNQYSILCNLDKPNIEKNTQR